MEELQDPRERRNEHALTRKARKRAASGRAPDSRGVGDGSDGGAQSSGEKSGQGGDGRQSPRPGSVMRGCGRGGRGAGEGSTGRGRVGGRWGAGLRYNGRAGRGAGLSAAE
eukprot:468240-Prymnesium_polylepis.2